MATKGQPGSTAVRQRYAIATKGVKSAPAPKAFAKGGSVEKGGFQRYGNGFRKTKG